MWIHRVLDRVPSTPPDQTMPIDHGAIEPNHGQSDDVSMSPCHGTEHPTQWSQQLAAACVLVCVFFWGDGGWQRPNQRWSVQENKVSRPTPQILILLG